MVTPGFLTALERSCLGNLEALGPWAYLILAAVIFCESGVLPLAFLPGDSLLFAVGALTVVDGPYHFPFMFGLLTVSGVLGYAFNYRMGKRFARAVKRRGKVLIVRERHLREARSFCERFGVAGIAIARFFPFVRTFAPFVAGMADMPGRLFVVSSVVGAALWTGAFLLAGRLFGNIPLIRDHLATIVMVVVTFSLVPPAVRALWRRFGPGRARRARAEAEAEAADGNGGIGGGTGGGIGEDTGE